jgi:hypothetical protein
MRAIESPREIALARLKERYSSHELRDLQKGAVAIYRNCGHPSVLAVSRLLLQAAHQIEKENA